MWPVFTEIGDDAENNAALTSAGSKNKKNSSLLGANNSNRVYRWVMPTRKTRATF